MSGRNKTFIRGTVIGIFACLAVMIMAIPVLAEKHLTVYDGFNYAPVYDYDYYAAQRGLTGASDEAVLKDFVTYGMPNTIQASPNFDVRSYWRGNPDLRRHYHERVVSSIKNFDSYKSTMKKMWPYIYQHYCRYGRNEASRVGTTTGIKKLVEPVTTYDGFNWQGVYRYEYYTSRYPSLNSATYFLDDDIATLEHFVLYGMSQKKMGRDTFNVDSYRYANPDLRIAYGKDYPKYYKHFVLHGWHEASRKGTYNNPSKYNQAYMVNNAITYFKVNGTTIDFSKIYDFKYYRSVNQKFLDDDAGAIANFVRVTLLAQQPGKKGVTRTNADYQALFAKVYPGSAEEYKKAYKYTSSTNFLFLVNKTKRHVYIFKKSGSGSNMTWTLFDDFPCCVGKSSTRTPTGVYKLQDRGYYFNTGERRCFYWTRIVGGILFHSVIYYQDSSPLRVADGTMGAAVSHGCIRLPLSKCKWIYDNYSIVRGSTVVTYGSP